MRPSSLHAALAALLIAASAASVTAQVIPGWDTKQFKFEQIDAERIRLVGQVEINGVGSNEGQQMFADELVWNTRTGEFEASGNVLVVTPTSRLSAERVVFNTKTGLGTFHKASGLAALGERAAQDRSMFGTLEPEVYFYGETIEKTGEDRYVVSDGGFTTCVQPTPRWEIVSGRSTINLEDYAILRNAVVRVKDVPVFYLPVLYYPIQSDDRATGFLLPTYGRSTYRGQSISNAFFWAINRSQDLTFFHDWYTKTGQGAGAEYRYAAAPGAEGFFRGYWLRENDAVFANDGQTATTPERRSYEIRAEAAQPLPAGIRARTRIDYFSSLTSNQLYNTNIYEASRRQRTISGSVTGAWAGVTVNGNFQRAELFQTETDTIVNGYAPSMTANLSSRRLGSLPLYFAMNAEASRILYVQRTATTEDDDSLNRVDVSPTLRVALTTWPFLNVNATAVYRHTYFSESLDETGQQVPAGLSRRYAELRADFTGPVFSRVFTPNNALAERLKHVIEPVASIQRITRFDNEDLIPLISGSYDRIIGGVTRINYGLTNRVLVRQPARAESESPAASAPRELLTVGLTQSYYTDPVASQFDLAYQSSYGIRPASSFSPVALSVRANPTAFSTASLRLEYDAQLGQLQGLNVTANTNYRSAQTTVGWSTRRSFDDEMDNALSGSTTMRLLDGRTGGSFFIDWDIRRQYIIQHRWIGFYNAQCCGIVFEYQEYNFPSGNPLYPIPKDRRFNMSFTLAGIGTFSNFFGAFGGTSF